MSLRIFVLVMYVPMIGVCVYLVFESTEVGGRGLVGLGTYKYVCNCV